ncbi:MAG: helix-turn-helix domain-containing protein [Puniceicoccaceae bacterium]|nr:MAG: helix-turn-helix domain-containing protein [Puniceicoccaceae bacterium]
MNSNNQDRLLTVQDVAERLSLSVRAVYRLIAEKQLPQPVKLGRASRLYTSDISRYLDSLRNQRGRQ